MDQLGLKGHEAKGEWEGLNIVEHLGVVVDLQ